MRERRAHPHLNPPPPKSSPIKGEGRSYGHKLAEYLSLSVHKGDDRESIEGAEEQSRGAERVIDSRAFDLREQWHRAGVESNIARGMELVPFTPDIQAAVKEVLRSRVVPSWVQRAGGQEATRLFNDIVGPYAGFTVAP
jgi:hypothetical protein